ncbi:N-acyl-D-amino-acid deacylase family protein [Sphingopyxis alaskensis]|jgi:N-acyl-D-amino-acid deacylase|uniref:N-acyl-D-amino-acid deacylase n=1 Tax=Sphingopyxis alaskensis (strain DSM 13593 / LMG 18877 / RB2256) TaxID=317655 RepID=Q1GT42_SPHAL|nr:D-aminoacylase [Sphingopyxis alaskensis]ABF53180.1 N-acyl-D-amino-acid deacylase [Sphingopyxis alaskensis RB2256]MCM3418599.1 D-aminoacylase [Sphingopyxis alaskensis]
MASPRRFVPSLWLLYSSMLLAAPVAAQTPAYDVIIRGGTIYDGSGKAPIVGDVAIKGDRIVAVGTVGGDAKSEVSARGMAVAPGFINMLSWATESLIADPKSQSDIRQGVTLEVMGEGWSMGPMNAAMKAQETARQGDIKYAIEWTNLGDYLGWLEKRGISTNVASFVGAATVRVHELGEGDVDPTPDQLDRMRALVRQAMNEGAMGVGSSLIYAPGSYAETDELVALTSEAAKCGGMYISHMRSEGDRIEEAVDELIEISRRSGAPAEIYHLKMAGRSNWDKLDTIVKKIEDARGEGLRITTDMYTYTAGATGLDAAMPTWVQAGGLEQWIERLKDPAIRARVAEEMKKPGRDWENLYYGAGADKMILSGFKNDALKPLTGKTLAEVAAMRGKSPEETAMDLVIEDGSRVGTVYFLMSEDNVRRQIQLPWMSFGSDAASQATEGIFLKSGAHPRTYGNFARLLGRYVRDEELIPLEQAVYRLTTLPATNLGLPDRGALKPGYYADVVVFDPATVADRSTFEQPHRYSVGVRDVFVNGTQVLKDGEHSGATPGRAVRGRGWNRCP